MDNINSGTFLIKRVIIIAAGLLLLLFLVEKAVGQPVVTGADQVKAYASLLRGKKVGLIANQTSLIKSPDGYVHLADSLLSLRINVVAIFSPEHGFKGRAGAGEKVGHSTYADKIPVISLYGDNYKPKKEDLKDIDVMLFDIQDVGARFYTYISTLHYVMEACAENNKPLIVLDRPNPNGFYVDGPVLEPKLKSFVGLHPIPVVHGMTIGEIAMMINGEKWIKSAPCSLKVIRMKNYTYDTLYELPVSPSPNLSSMASVYLYPSLCFFEGTRVSVARGTDRPFQMIGYPGFEGYDVSFRPQSTEAAPKPMYKDTLCHGWDLARNVKDTSKLPAQLNLTWLIKMYQSYPDKQKFFNPFFDKLAGTAKLREQIIAGLSEEKIRESWQTDLKAFKEKREKYLFYKK